MIEVAARRGAYVPHETNGLTCPTEAIRGIENIGEYRRLSNPESTFANENPGALAGATGAKQIDRVIKTEHYRKRADAATALCHAIAECDPADACEVMAVAYGDLRAGMPIAPLEGLMSEARIWAEFATRDELKAYCAATFAAMPARDQAAFLGYAQGRAAA